MANWVSGFFGLWDQTWLHFLLATTLNCQPVLQIADVPVHGILGEEKIRSAGMKHCARDSHFLHSSCPDASRTSQKRRFLFPAVVGSNCLKAFFLYVFGFSSYQTTLRNFDI
jgi:hypothetical protein